MVTFNIYANFQMSDVIQRRQAESGWLEKEPEENI